MPTHKPGESIEGLKIQGHSRDPLRSKPVKKINGLKYFVYKAEFNVFAEIVAGLSPDILPDKKLDKNALIMEGETLGCDTALIITIAKTGLKKLFLMFHIRMEQANGNLHNRPTLRLLRPVKKL